MSLNLLYPKNIIGGQLENLLSCCLFMLHRMLAQIFVSVLNQVNHYFHIPFDNEIDLFCVGNLDT